MPFEWNVQPGPGTGTGRQVLRREGVQAARAHAPPVPAAAHGHVLPPRDSVFDSPCFLQPNDRFKMLHNRRAAALRQCYEAV